MPYSGDGVDRGLYAVALQQTIRQLAESRK
jgi:hypothetical protein